MTVRALIQVDQEAVGIFPFGDERTFKTGSKGFHSQGKVPINGKRYQANLMLIEVGSKPKKGSGKK